MWNILWSLLMWKVGTCQILFCYFLRFYGIMMASILWSWTGIFSLSDGIWTIWWSIRCDGNHLNKFWRWAVGLWGDHRYKLSGTQDKNWIEHFGLNGVKVRIDIFVGVLKRAAPFFLIISFTVGRTQCCFKDEFTWISWTILKWFLSYCGAYDFIGCL